MLRRFISVLLAAFVASSCTYVQRASVSSSGAQASARSWSTGPQTLSGDGRSVVFLSDASDLVAGDTNGVADVFVRDNGTGVVRRVSVATGGAQANGESTWASISGDGSLVVFASKATNLAPGDDDATQDIFVHDLLNATTTHVPRAYDDGPGWYGAYQPVVSPNGRFLFFVDHPEGAYSYFGRLTIHDRATGEFSHLSGQTNKGLSPVMVSDDGRFAAIYSGCGGSQCPIGMGKVMLWDRVASTVEDYPSPDESAAYAGAKDGAVTPDGRYVAYTQMTYCACQSESSITIADRIAGTKRRFHTRVGGGLHARIGISADGRYVAFTSLADDLVAGDSNEGTDVFVLDTMTGVTTLATSGGIAQPGSGQVTSWQADLGAISADGRYVSFSTTDPTIVPGDTNSVEDVFVRYASPPRVLGVEPPKLWRSLGGRLVLNGSGFREGMQVSVGEGVSVRAVTLVVPTQAWVDVVVADEAPLGPRDVVVTVPGASPLQGGASTVCSGCVTVTEPWG